MVDDSRVLCLTVNAMLKAEHIIVNSCGIASEAMGMALTFKPTVILQDLVMPDVEGLDMVRMFKTDPRTQDIPLVMLSSTEDPKVKSDSFAEGANDYIVKLPDRLELLARVRYHSKGYRALVERNQVFIDRYSGFTQGSFSRFTGQALTGHVDQDQVIVRSARDQPKSSLGQFLAQNLSVDNHLRCIFCEIRA